MTWIRWILLESPLAFGALAFTVNFFLLSWWRRSGNPRPLFVGLVAAAGGFLLQAAVETRREWASRVFATIEAEAVEGRVDTLATILAGDFAAGEYQRDAFLDLARERLSRYRISTLERKGFREIADAGGGFTIAARYRVAGDFGRELSAFVAAVDFRFVRAGDGWVLAEIPPPQIGPFHLNSWNEAGR